MTEIFEIDQIVYFYPIQLNTTSPLKARIAGMTDNGVYLIRLLQPYEALDIMAGEVITAVPYQLESEQFIK